MIIISPKCTVDGEMRFSSKNLMNVRALISFLTEIPAIRYSIMEKLHIVDNVII